MSQHEDFPATGTELPFHATGALENWERSARNLLICRRLFDPAYVSNFWQTSQCRATAAIQSNKTGWNAVKGSAFSFDLLPTRLATGSENLRSRPARAS